MKIEDIKNWAVVGIEYFDYKNRTKYQVWRCERCRVVQSVKFLASHHVYGRRYSDLCIWLCWKCHEFVQTHPKYAYKHGFSLVRDQNMQEKQKKSKKCTHASSYYDAKLGYIKCQFCGQEVNAINFGKKKPVKPYEKKHKKVTKSVSLPKVSMGFEHSDPRISQAEKLKRSLVANKLKIKKVDPASDEWKNLKKNQVEIKRQMKALQASYED